MYVVFRCPGCGRHLYASVENKTRRCVCGRSINVRGVVVLARCDDEREAGEVVRRFQAPDGEEPEFVTYRRRKDV